MATFSGFVQLRITSPAKTHRRSVVLRSAKSPALVIMRRAEIFSPLPSAGEKDRPQFVQGVEVMNSSIIRFAKSTPAIETGFVAAGLTVSLLAVGNILLNVIALI